MSDLLGWLDNLDTVFLGDSRDDDFQGGLFVRLGDVDAGIREALRNPTDEQVGEIADFWHNYHYAIFDTITGRLECVCGDTGDRDLHRIRVVQVAAAGVDDE